MSAPKKLSLPEAIEQDLSGRYAAVRLDLQECKKINLRLNDENYLLRKALEKYAHCRHSSQNCFCTMEARAALYVPLMEKP